MQTALTNVRFDGNNGHNGYVTLCLLMTHSRHWSAPSAAGCGMAPSLPHIAFFAKVRPTMDLKANSEEELVEALEKTLDCPMTSEAPLSFGGLSPSAQ